MLPAFSSVVAEDRMMTLILEPRPSRPSGMRRKSDLKLKLEEMRQLLRDCKAERSQSKFKLTLNTVTYPLFKSYL